MAARRRLLTSSQSADSDPAHGIVRGTVDARNLKSVPIHQSDRLDGVHPFRTVRLDGTDQNYGGSAKVCPKGISRVPGASLDDMPAITTCPARPSIFVRN